MIELCFGVVIGAGLMALVQNRSGIVSVVVMRKGERPRDAHGRFVKGKRAAVEGAFEAASRKTGVFGR